MTENNEKKRWGRRLSTTIAWAVLLNAAFYACVFKGIDVGWFQTYAGYMTLGLGFLVGGLTITDVVLKK